MFEDIVRVIKELDRIEDKIEKIPKELSEEELKLNDLYHTLEFYKLDVSQCWYLAKEMKKVLNNRRDVKNKMSITKVYTDNINKLINKDSRRFLLSEVGKKNKIVKNQKYNYNCYTKEQLVELGILKDGQNEQRCTK